jgi:hypothetical protein
MVPNAEDVGPTDQGEAAEALCRAFAGAVPTLRSEAKGG